MLYKLTRSSPVCRDVTPLTFEAPFLLHPPSGRSLLRANRRRRRDAKPRGLALRDSPAAGGSNPAPRPDTRARGFFRLPASTDSSRSHRVLGRTMSGRRSPPRDRKSTRLNSSHGYISYAVFCLKKKKTTN